MRAEDRFSSGPSEPGAGEGTPDLESELATLFARERRAHPSPGPSKERVLSRLERSLNLGPRDPHGGGSGAVATSVSSARSAPTLTRLVSTLSMAACVVAGATLLWSLASEGPTARSVAGPEPLASPVAKDGVSPNVSLDSPLDNTAGLTAIPVEALPSVHAPIESAARVPTRRKTERPASCTICEERAILDVARRGLREKEGAPTLDAIDEHQSRFPTGQLAEERESLRVHVLFALGRVDEAEARKGEFVRLYPQSPLLESVKRAGVR